ncbi:hypothetical protein K7X08_030099 [Anisodus acutangulus]|uniref:TF-B3 domain-containing protein n=1 Tax=Anisodus acutangulus TaxID=402998 RepID=A0A9Q1LK80_9SOLA|nr:hypothetical protein K7X08_030099 [Anisodus acutangulus]
MKVPPKKPRFFKPIVPGFKDGLNIPTSFLKYLKGQDHIEHAVLKWAGNKWLVKLNNQRFEDGWKKFAEELNLQLGDLLIFKHEGGMKFEVSILDSSQCDRELRAEKKAHTLEETSKKFVFKDRRGDASLQPKGKKTNLDTERVSTQEKPNTSNKSSIKASSPAKAAAYKPFGCPNFVCTIRPYFLTYGFLRIPRHFATANCLINKKYDLSVRDEKQRSWNLKLSSCKTQVFIKDGWRKFIADNCLKEGDHIMFEVVTDGETPVWKFHVVTDAETPMRKFQAIAGRRIRSSDVTATSFDANPHFISTIKSYAIRYPFLYLPLAFAKSTGLMNGRREMILIDEKHRSWSMWLGPRGKNFVIRRGWTRFIKANGFREGDIYKFELIHNGQIPIAYVQFVGKYSGKDA